MISNRLSAAMAVLFLFLSLCGVQAQGQYQMPSSVNTAVLPASSGSYPASQDASLQYSQYYIMPQGSASFVHLTALERFELNGNTPASLYLSGQVKAVPYAQYQASYKGGNALWIQGSESWTQYVVVPQGAFLSLIATSPAGGNGYLNEIYPDGKLVKNNEYFYPASRIGIYADTIGQHILLFAIGDQVSNSIVIQVTSPTPSGYQQPAYYQPPSYAQPVYYRPVYESPFYFFPRHREPRNVSPDDHWRHDDQSIT
jgi:hypothetical protein